MLFGKLSFNMLTDTFDVSEFNLVENLDYSPNTGIKIDYTVQESYQAQSTFRFTDATASKDAFLKDLIVSSGSNVEESTKYKEYELTPSFDKDINEYELDELRNIITYVPQDSYLFEGTIAENIAFGWNGENVPSMEMIIAASKEAYADKFIEHLPDGYNTKVTAGGTNLSGGQRQRIAIARAFMKNAPIVLMDEPSSALDTDSENVLLKAMKTLLKNKTVIMVSHRMTGMDKFERIVRME